MYIDMMPDVLQWHDYEEICFTVHEAYEQLIAKSLAKLLRDAEAEKLADVDLVRKQIRALPNRSLIRFMLAPAVSFRLLWPRNNDLCSRYSYLRKALAAEEWLNGENRPAKIAWTALGDFCLHPNGAIEPSPHVDGLPPLDFDSPHALGLDLNGVVEILNKSRPSLDTQHKEIVLERLTNGVAAVNAIDQRYLNFFYRFTKVLVIQLDPDMPSFTSGTSGQYVGRSVLANAHLPTSTTEMIIEGIVHESIHGLLYMQEQLKQWVNDSDLYGGTIRTESPWTGTKLPLRPYIQAAFVWYGLFHFWAQANVAGVFDAQRRRARLISAARGFLGEPLVNQIAQWRTGIAPELLQAIDRMQHHVQRAVSDINN